MQNKITKLNTGFTRTPKFGVTPKGGGFTLIETMISVALFIVIVMAGMTSLLNANLLQQKSSDMRSIIDNLSFVMDDMSRNLRTGYDYECITGTTIPDPIVATSGTGCGGVAFESTADELTTPWAYFIGQNSNGKYGIYKSVDGGTAVQLTPDEVNIDTSKSGFKVYGAEPPTSGDTQQPFVTIKLVGTINSKGISTPFSLQTSVSQRKLDTGI